MRSLSAAASTIHIPQPGKTKEADNNTQNRLSSSSQNTQKPSTTSKQSSSGTDQNEPNTSDTTDSPLTSGTDHPHTKPLSAKEKFNQKHIHINQEYFTDFARALLLSIYPKTCKNCGGTEFKAISTRETEIRCSNPKCKTHVSLTSYTPAHHLKIPLWAFAYMIQESIDLHPQPLTVAHICRKLKVGRSTGTTLKRRIQLLCSDLIPAVKALIVEAINADFPSEFVLPNKSEDVSELVKDKAVVYSDIQALFSATRRSNGFRSRYKHNGQTSSIYLSDEVAEERGFTQIGTLVHTIGLKNGAVIFTSIRDQSQERVEPLFDWLPAQTPIFTDEGFPYLNRHDVFDNCRQVNHSARAKNQKRNVWAKHRFSCNGVHNNTAEGHQRALKTCMRAYSYIKPENSQLYLNEYSLLKAVRVYGLKKIVMMSESIRSATGPDLGNAVIKLRNTSPEPPIVHAFLKQALKPNFYTPPATPEERNHANFSKTRKKIPWEIKQLCRFQEMEELRNAVEDYYFFWSERSPERRKKENEFNAYARRLFTHLKKDRADNLRIVCNVASIPHLHAIRIVRIWHKLKIANVECIQRAGDKRVHYTINVSPSIKKLPSLLYTYDKTDMEELLALKEAIERQDPPKNPRLPKYGMSKDKRKQKLEALE